MRQQPLGEFFISHDRQRKPVKESDRKPGPFPYYGASGVVDHVDGYLFNGDYLLIAEDGENLRTRQTPIAFMASGKFWVNNHAHIIQANATSDTRYLMYALQVADVAGFLTGSTMPKLTAGNLARIPIPAPPLNVQRAIAHVLGSLDDKIASNLKMNATLEAMAQALFKSWFVNFDLVGGPLAQRKIGMAGDLSSLFPNVFVDGLPLGWSREALLSQARLVSGGTPKTSIPEYWHGAIKWATAKDISQCGDSFIIDTERLITERGLAESATRLVSAFATVIVARGATTGRFCMLGEQMAMNQTCYGLVSVQEFPFWLYCAISTVVNDLVSAAHGTVFDTITTQTFENAHVTVAPRPIMKAFEKTARPLFERMLVNLHDSRNLRNLRDALLPKLISGELRVAEAEFISEKSA